jgi:hypothetical protein
MLRWPARRQRRASLVAGSAIVALSAAALYPVTAASAAPPPSPGQLSATQAAGLAKGNQKGVIVLLKNQHPEAPPRTATNARKAAVKGDQSPYLKELKQVGATNVKTYTLVNGFSAHVSAAEAARLAADPQVASVSPERVYTLPRQDGSVTKTTPKPAGAKSTGKAGTAPGICPANPAKPLLEPEALQLSHTAYDDPAVPQAQTLATGKGVKVAFLADGADVNNPDFIRTDGSHVFVDYQNFGGNGDQSDGRESFGDASSLAAQGRHVYDLSEYASPGAPLPKGCTVRIRGMAPDVSLVGINLSGPVPFFTNSTIVEAIDYAVTQQNVDIVNESLGGLGLPSTLDNPVVAANDAAVASGVTVVASTGDQGPTGTVGSPAMDPKIIAAGGSTALRALAQTSWGGFPLSNGHWVSNNISSFASAGTTQLGRAPDLVAPAERGWATCSKNTTLYTGCKTYDGRPTDIFPFGGTSESSPLIAGEAALVIQAYKQAHHGVRPTPALVKRLLTSTATDLGLPSDEQGAGEFNAYAAVRAALSWKDGNGSPAPQGDALVLNKTQLLESAPVGSTVHDTFSVTNTSNQNQTVSARGRTLGGAFSNDHGTLTLDSTKPGLPTFFDGHYTPGDRVYLTRTFTVPPGADYLSASIAYPSGGSATRNSEPQITLLDPNKTFTAESYTSAGSGFGRVDVHNPVPGTWTEVFATAATGGFKGKIAFDLTTQKYKPYGTVTPASRILKPGQSGTFQVSGRAGDAAGDLAAAIQLDTPKHLRLAMPLTVRSVITKDHNGGRFSGVLSGANGGPGTQQYKGYYLDVPAGRHDLSLNVHLQNPNTVVYGTLVDPSGQPLALTSDVFTDPAGNQSLTGSLQMFRAKPAAGRWLLVLSQLNPANGTEVKAPFTGRLQFDTVSVKATGLPNNSHTVLPAGKPVTTTVTVKNTGNTPELFFTDGRLSGQYADLPLISPNPTTGVPLGNVGGFVFWPVPTQTTGLTFTGTSTIPIQLDAGFNDPSYYGPPNGNTATVTVTGSPLAQGGWVSDATIYGPTGGTVHHETVNLTATAHTMVFDSGLTSSTGDIWLKSVSGTAPAFTPIAIQPGQTGTITVTLTPTAAKGTVVRGNLYVDDFNTFGGDGDELSALPYTYTVG